MRGILTDAHLECWRHFALACWILVKFELTHTDVLLADALLLQFCKGTKRLYGKSAITPNIHLHCHLKECILDFGPIHNIWCFSFERYSGILGDLLNNNRSIEVQVMNRSIRDSALTSHHIHSQIHLIKSLPPFPHQNVRGLLDSVASTSSTTCCLSIPDDVESHLL